MTRLGHTSASLFRVLNFGQLFLGLSDISGSILGLEKKRVKAKTQPKAPAFILKVKVKWAVWVMDQSKKSGGEAE